MAEQGDVFVNHESDLVGFQDMGIEELLSFHRGWVDGQHCGRWPKEYEFMSPELQFMYEHGRLAVLNVMNVGPVPIWKGDRHTACGPVEDAVFRSIETAGYPWP